MNKTELSLLLYLECRATDYDGRVNMQQMNDDDQAIATKWNDSGFIEFGRIIIADHNRDGTHYVRLSAEAVELAHAERKSKANKGWENRRYTTTKEKRGAPLAYGDLVSGEVHKQ